MLLFSLPHQYFRLTMSLLTLTIPLQCELFLFKGNLIFLSCLPNSYPGRCCYETVTKFVYGTGPQPRHSKNSSSRHLFRYDQLFFFVACLYNLVLLNSSTFYMNKYFLFQRFRSLLQMVWKFQGKQNSRCLREVGLKEKLSMDSPRC